MISKTTIISIGTDRNLFSLDSIVAKRQIEYAKALSSEIKIIVFALKKNNFQSKILSDNLTVYPTNSSNRLFYIWDAIILARSVIADRKVILVSAQDPFETGFSALFISQFLKCPLHIQIHTDLYSPYFKINFLNRLRLFLAQLVIKRASHIRVVSDRIKENLQSNFKQLPTISVLPIFSDFTALKNQKPNEDFQKKYKHFSFIILWAGRLEQEKNPLLAIKVMSLVLVSQPQVCLIIVGRGRLEGKILREIKRLKLTKNIFFESWQENLPACLMVADAYLSTSWYEGYGLALVEAAAIGCPIVSTNTGLAGSMFIDNKEALICQPGDAIGLAAKICRLINNQKLKQRLTTEACHKVFQFSQSREEFMKKYINDIEQASSIS